MIKKLLNYLDLKSDLHNVDEIHRTIRNGIIFKGTNLWILVFAIIIASVGLNTNSTAVIIGAMLISPLMGPINGMGYSIATYDFVLFRRALKNFGFAVSASLLTSTLYFLVSPISTAHSELLARTSPTIYDVLIALFGGLAGIVAISSKHKGNVIPGVAIATALMPPLCTAGFGLATGQFTYFFGAFYLFTINTVFIGISSVFFSQVLNFPIRTLVEPAQKRRVNRWITIVIVITIIPSLYFGYLLVEKEKFTDKANNFVSSIGAIDGSYLLRYDVNARTKIIKLVYGGNTLRESSRNAIIERALDYKLNEVEIIFEQGFSFSTVSEDISKIDNSLRAELNRLNAELQKNEHRRDSIEGSYSIGKILLNEIQTIYPEISALTYANAVEYYAQADSTTFLQPDSLKVPIVILTLQKNNRIKASEKSKIEDWLQKRLAVPNRLKVLYQAE
jgi:uncharacterized hydrophobic protein (TIGR00271 family)